MAGLSMAFLHVCKKFEVHVTDLNALQREDSTNFVLMKRSLFTNFENWI